MIFLSVEAKDERELDALRKHLTRVFGDRLGMFHLVPDAGGVLVTPQEGNPVQEWPEEIGREILRACAGWEPPQPPYEEMRRREYPSLNDLIVALWEREVEGRPEAAEAIQPRRLAVKARHPKRGE